uniref:Transmembrane p24 trafficking protein 10 n=1 Tax=Sander lucioperca TaxID=283035 RepID=A0A8C9XWB7_SANLU
MSRLCVFLLIAVLLDPMFSITFYLPANSGKCLQDNIYKNVLVSCEYETALYFNVKNITDSFGDILYTQENATKGNFSFATENHDQFDVCFNSRSPMGSGWVPDQLVQLDIEQRTPKRHLEHLSLSVADDFIHLKKRGEEMQQTNSKLIEQKCLNPPIISIISVCCFLALATWQTFYSRRFFKTRKLIE